MTTSYPLADLLIQILITHYPGLNTQTTLICCDSNH